MRREIFYSMLAAAAFPAMANANAVKQNAVVIKQWTGGTLSTDGSTYASSGASIKYNVGSLVPGSYKLTINDVDSKNGAVTVKVGSKTVTVAKSEGLGKAEVEFELKSATQVTIEVSSFNAVAFGIGASTLELVSTEALTNNINALLQTASGATVEINSWTGFTGLDDAVAKIGVIQTSLNSVLADNSGEGGGYQYYADKQLYTESGRNAVTDEINAIKSDAATAYEAQVNQLLTLFKAGDNYKTYEAIPTIYKEPNKAAIDEIEAAITAFNTSVSEHKALDDYKSAISEIDTKVKTLNSTVEKANKENKEAYDAVVSNADAAKGSYLVDLKNALTAKDVVSSIYPAGNAVLSDLIAQLETVKKDAKASYDAGTAVADRADKTEGESTVKGYDSRINDLSGQLSAAYSLYSETLPNALKGLNDDYTDVSTSASNAKKDFASTVLAKHEAEVKALDDAVAALRKAIDDVNTEANCTKLESLQSSEEYLALRTNVATAISKLQEVCQAEQAKVNADKDAATAITGVQTKLNTAKTDANKLKYGSTTNLASSSWSGWVAEIQSKIDSISSVQKANAANEKLALTDDFYADGKGYKKAVGDINAAIEDFTTKTNAAASNYNAVNTAVNAAQTSLTTAKKKVENTAAWYSTASNEGKYNYQTNVATAQKTIDDAKAAMTKFAALKDKDNVDSIANKLRFDNATVTEVVDHINTKAEADIQAAEAAALAAQKTAVKSIVNKLNSDKSDITNTTADVYGLANDSIKAELTKIAIPTVEELNKATGEDAKAADIQAVLTKANTARTAMDKLIKAADTAKARVQRNADIAEKLLAQVASLGWDGGSTIRQKAGVGTASDAYNNGTNGFSYTKGTTTYTNEKGELDYYIKSIRDSKTAIDGNRSTYKGSIYTSKAKETLVADSAKIAQSIANLKTLITNTESLAETLLKNYKAYTNLTAKVDEYKTAIATAKSAAEAADPESSDTGASGEAKFGAGKSYYSATVFGKEATASPKADAIGKYKDADDKLTAYKTQYGKKNFSAKQAIADNETALTEAVNQSIADVKAYATNQIVENNLAAYKKNDVAYANAKDSITLYNNRLASAVETSTLPQTQAQLNALADQVKSQFAQDGKDYLSGNAADNTAKYTGLVKQMQTLVDAATDPEKVNPQVTAENEAMYKKIVTAKDSATAAYNTAVAYVGTFANLKSANLTDAENGISSLFNEANNELAKWPTTLANAMAKVDEEYLAAKAPTMFDKKGTHVTEFQGYEKDIEDAQKKFKTNVADALSSIWASKKVEYQRLYNDTLTAAKAYNLSLKADDTEKTYFQSLSDKVDQAETYQKGAEIVNFDNSLSDLEKNFKNELATALDNTAKADLNGAINDRKSKVNDNKAFLEANYPSDVATYEAQVKCLNDADSLFNASKDYSKDYEAIKALIAEYDGNIYNNDKDNTEKYDKAIASINTQRDAVKEAAEALKDYGCIGALNTQTDGFNALNAALDDYLKTANDFKSGKVGVTVPDSAAIATDIATKLAALINGAKADGETSAGNLYTAEKTYLLGLESSLNTAYNTWVDGKTDKEKTAEKTAIDNLIKKVNDADSSEDIKNAADLQKMEDEFKAELNKLQSDAEKAADIKALTDALNDITTTFADGTDEFAVKEFKSQMDALQAEKERIAKAIADSKSIAFDKASIQSDIAALKTKAEDLAPQVKAKSDAYKKVVADNNKILADATAAQKALQEAYDKSFGNTDYTVSNATADVFSAKYANVKNQIDDFLKPISDTVAVMNAARKELSYDYTSDSTAIANALKSIDNARAYRQLKSDAAKLQAKYEALQKKVDGFDTDNMAFTKDDIDNIKATLADIRTALSDSTTTGEVTSETSGILYDIARSYNDDNNSAERFAEITEAIQEQSKSIDALDEKIKGTTKTTGDVNGDGVTDIVDLQAIINALNSDEDAEDVNGDGIVDILDIQAAINYLKN